MNTYNILYSNIFEYIKVFRLTRYIKKKYNRPCKRLLEPSIIILQKLSLQKEYRQPRSEGVLNDALCFIKNDRNAATMARASGDPNPNTNPNPSR